MFDDAGASLGVRVVVGAKSTRLNPTTYRLLNAAREEEWTPLKRGEGKSGVTFKLLRQVATIETVM